METTLPSSHGVSFGRLAASIGVQNLNRSLQFYCGVLGFNKVFENGNPVGFAILKKDKAELHLAQNKNHKAPLHNVAHLMVEDATVLYEHCAIQNVRIIKTLRDADFGLRCFVLADPDGNRIDIGQVLPTPEVAD
ncbi:MAG: VOC family protein [Pseudomonadota bacterium]|jgi:catechol 2,3-dioxygenase-like lactoylglutathione lyase family enzyme|uniref:VOC family protein n=1 Tax=Burkholderiaceae TaxID=119060 RepID=UPI0010F74B8D|nr:VOC family protein [Burkholderia sp. 4M9327F10]